MENSVIGRLETLRSARGCSQASFARQCGLGVGNLNKMFKGKEKITDRTLYRIAETFSVNLEWLRDGIGEMYKADRRETDAQFAQAQRWLNESEGKSVSVNTIHGDNNNSGTQTIGASDTGVVALLKEKIAMLERLLEEKDKQIADKDGYIKMLIGARVSGSVVP